MTRIKIADVLILVTIVVVTILAWNKIVGFIFTGDDWDYIYINNPLTSSLPNITNFGKIFNPHFWGRSDIFGMMFFSAIYTFFGSNLHLYRWIELAMIVLVNIEFYWMLSLILKNKIFALLGAVVFSLDYIGGGENYVQYAYFMQRFPAFLLMPPSIVFLLKYYERHETKYYYFSLLFLVIAVYLAHFSVFLSVFLIFIVVAHEVQFNDILSSCFRCLIKVAPILIFVFFWSLFSVSGPLAIRMMNLKSPESVNPFVLLTKLETYKKVVYQLAVISIPQEVVSMVEKSYGRGHSIEGYRSALLTLSPFAAMAYLAVLAFITKLSRKRYVLVAAACFLSLLTILFANVYIERDLANIFSVYTEMYQGRYYITPWFFLSILAAIFFLAVYEAARKVRFVFAGLVIFVFLNVFSVYQIEKIWDYLNKKEWVNVASYKTIDWIRQNQWSFEAGTLIAVPYPLGPLAIPFLQVYYPGNGIKYIYMNNNLNMTIRNEGKDEAVALSYGVSFADQLPDNIIVDYQLTKINKVE